MTRQLKREVKIGNIKIGGTNPIAVQTMLNVPVKDIAGNVAQAKRVAAAGCQIVRVTVPSPSDAAVVAAIKEAVDIPVVADIHFDYRAALAALDALCRPFAKGETLLEAGQRGAPMGVVLAGRVLIEHLDLWGNRTLLGRAAEGELFAETYAFLPDQPMLVSVVAAERGEALFLDPGKLMAPGCEPWRWQMMQNLLHILAGKNLNLARRSLYTAPKTIRERVTAYFSTLAVQKGSLEFELPFDRQQLADHLGVDRSALSSTLSAMQRDGLLTIDRRRVCLKKAEGL